MLTAVEPDADQMATLKTRIAQLLPNVSAEFCQETAQSWKGSDGPFDAVLMFHILCYIPELERPALLKKLFDNVTTNGGLVFILTSPCNMKSPTMLIRLIDLLSLPSYDVYYFVDGVHVCDLMTSAGFHACYQQRIEYQFDMQEPNDDMLSVFTFLSQGKLSLEQVREAAEKVLGGEKAIQHEMWLGVFEQAAQLKQGLADRTAKTAVSAGI